MASSFDFDPADVHPHDATGTGPHGDWVEPVPPINPDAVPPLPYPVDAFPETMRAAILEYQAYGQQPLALIGLSACSALSLAAQHLADVQRDPQLVGPISLNALAVAVSGERKTTADKVMTRALRAREGERRLAQAGEVAAHEAAVVDFKLQVSALESELKEARKKRGKDLAKAEALRRDLADLKRTAPVAPPEFILFHEDSTIERLLIDMGGGWPSTSVWSDEGGVVVGGHSLGKERAIGSIGLYNKLWDATPVRRRRVTNESAEVVGVRATINLMIQPAVLKQLVTLAGGAARSMGMVARFMVCHPESTIGFRPYVAPPEGMPAMAQFQGRLRELVAIEPEFPEDEQGRPIYQLQPEVLPLSAAAFEIWRQYHDDIEAEMRDDCEFEAVRDVASKSADNAARLAALFHLFEHGEGGEVSVPHMESGATLAAWHLHETRRVLGLVAPDKPIQDAIDVAKWLARQLENVSLRDLARTGPKALRPASARLRRGAALQMLVDLGLIRLTTERVAGSRRDLVHRHPNIADAT